MHTTTFSLGKLYISAMHQIFIKFIVSQRRNQAIYAGHIVRYNTWFDKKLSLFELKIRFYKYTGIQTVTLQPDLQNMLQKFHNYDPLSWT